MQTETHHEVEQQQHYGALIRSLSGESSAKIKDWQLFYKNYPFNSLAPHLNLKGIRESWAEPRGIIDGIALRLRFSDHDFYLTQCPQSLIESLIFEVLEQIRVESICPEGLKGCRQNIQSQFLAWMQQLMSTGATEGSIGLLLLSVFSTVWTKLNYRPVPQLMQDVVEATRAGIAESFGTCLVDLKSNRYDQAKYAKTSLEVTSLISHLIDDEYRNNPSIRTKRKPPNSSLLKIEWIPPHISKNLNGVSAPRISSREEKTLLNQALEKYFVFNSEYDLEIEAKKTIRPAQLAIYQHQLSDEISKLQLPWAKFTRMYQAIFATQAPGRLQTTETEGEIDRRYLVRAATSPFEPALYRHHARSPKILGKVTLLIDCSGSMKEQRLKIAIAVDSLVRILEQAKVQTEVLGYSTVAWQGGRPFKAWCKQGQIPNPGRLNERAHWIFKNFDTNWRRARTGIAALLRPEIYAESIDGEALIWAAERLLKSDVQNQFNKKLVLFSDGCPMDRATIEANGEDFLKNHLLQAIAWCEQQQQQIDLWGCGIGEELRSAFNHRLSWDQSQDDPSQNLLSWVKEFKTKRI